MTKINIGCGEFRANGWINIDIHAEDGPQPDIEASADDLPFKDKTVDLAYAGHFLEHIALGDPMKNVLDEIKRVLKDDGEAMFVGPDLTRAEKDWPEMVPAILNGEGRWPGDAHLWESRESTILDFLAEYGWDATAVPISDVPAQWPVTSYIGWQYAISAKPKAKRASSRKK